MHEFECGAKGTSRSPDGLVRINVTPSGECAIRINPHDAEREQLEDQIRQTFNSAVRRMSRNVAAADPLSLFESPDER